jgi:hypothetical protein
MRGYVIGGVGTVICGSIAIYGFVGGTIPSVIVAAVFTGVTTVSAIATIVDYQNTHK